MTPLPATTLYPNFSLTIFSEIIPHTSIQTPIIITEVLSYEICLIWLNFRHINILQQDEMRRLISQSDEQLHLNTDTGCG